MSLLCLNCNKPVTFDASIKEKYPEWEAMVKSSLKPARAGVQKKLSDGAHCSLSPPGSLTSALETQFSLLSHPVDKEEPNRGSAMSREVKTAENLFDIIANTETPVDHPVCQECTNKLLDAMDAQLKFYEDECAEYGRVAQELAVDEDGVDLGVLQKQIDELLGQERALRAELASLETEESSLEKELRSQDQELEQMKRQEEDLWRSYRNYRREFLELDSEKASLQNQLSYAEQQLQSLQRTSVFNMAFHLWHSGQFGTINGLRLGRLPNDPVDWQEINAAWGQATLLLAALARKLALTFDKYELIPFGNHSVVRVLRDKAQKDLPLHTTGGIKFFFNSDFDEAMVAYLDCLSQLKAGIEARDKDFCTPYAMGKDKIYATDRDGVTNSYCVKIQFNSEERWTKAMKCMLTNLKWALVWVSSLQS